MLHENGMRLLKDGVCPAGTGCYLLLRDRSVFRLLYSAHGLCSSLQKEEQVERSDQLVDWFHEKSPLSLKLVLGSVSLMGQTGMIRSGTSWIPNFHLLYHPHGLSVQTVNFLSSCQVYTLLDLIEFWQKPTESCAEVHEIRTLLHRYDLFPS